MAFLIARESRAATAWAPRRWRSVSGWAPLRSIFHLQTLRSVRGARVGISGLCVAAVGHLPAPCGSHNREQDTLGPASKPKRLNVALISNRKGCVLLFPQEKALCVKGIGNRHGGQARTGSRRSCQHHPGPCVHETLAPSSKRPPRPAQRRSASVPPGFLRQ